MKQRTDDATKTLLNEQLVASTDPAEQERIKSKLWAFEEEHTREANEAFARLPQDPTENDEEINKIHVSSDLEASQKLGQATFSVTARFFDGTTATKNYRISPVDNIEQLLADDYNGSLEASQENVVYFTITEIA